MRSPLRRTLARAASELLDVAQSESFQVLRERARNIVLEAEQHQDLARSPARRPGRHVDHLGMIDIHLSLEPTSGPPSSTGPRYRRPASIAPRGATAPPSPGAHLADAYATLLSGATMGRSRRPELVVLVSHEATKRGWKDESEGEVCKIPGIGPVSPKIAREIAEDAFLTGVFYDGVDLRHLRRWTRHTPIEVLIALELGDPPDFDGVSCADCGRRFSTENDHLEPHVAHGPASHRQPRTPLPKLP